MEYIKNDNNAKRHLAQQFLHDEEFMTNWMEAWPDAGMYRVHFTPWNCPGNGASLHRNPIEISEKKVTKSLFEDFFPFYEGLCKIRGCDLNDNANRPMAFCYVNSLNTYRAKFSLISWVIASGEKEHEYMYDRRSVDRILSKTRGDLVVNRWFINGGINKHYKSTALYRLFPGTFKKPIRL